MKKRSSNIELLRLICMGLVILHHFYVHTPWGELSESNRRILSLFGIWPAVSINCFIMITGYFMCTFKGNINQKVLKLWSQRVFFSIGITACFVVCNFASLSPALICQAAFPTITCRHNYVTTFIFLYLFIPYINRCLGNLSREEFEKLVIYSTLVMSFLPSVLGAIKLWSNNTYVYLLWMIYVYCLGAFFRTYPIKLPWKTLLLICIFTVLICTYWIEPKFESIPDGYTIGNRNNFIMLLCSICLFHVFANLYCPEMKAVNWLSASTFAVLLVHDDPLVRNILWTSLLQKIPSLGAREDLWLLALMVTIFIYIACAIIDKIRNWLFKNISLQLRLNVNT